MAKPRTVFVCSSCGADAPRWSGQCPSCGEWNTMAPFTEPRLRAAGQAARGGRPEAVGHLAAVPEARWSTGFAEFDRVLGGGVVPGSVTLIGGEPGIGKSTLLLQCAAALAAGQGVLYATGEESVRQVAERARRLERAHVAHVQQIEAPVRQHDLLARRPPRPDLDRQRIEGPGPLPVVRPARLAHSPSFRTQVATISTW